MNTPEWVHEPEAAKHLALKQNTLRTMRRERRLEPGEHWVYATGAVGGPGLYDLTAITEMQRRKTLEAVQAEDERRARQLNNQISPDAGVQAVQVNVVRDFLQQGEQQGKLSADQWNQQILDV